MLNRTYKKYGNYKRNVKVENSIMAKKICSQMKKTLQSSE